MMPKKWTYNVNNKPQYFITCISGEKKNNNNNGQSIFPQLKKNRDH